MRRDDIRGLTEKRKKVFADMHALNEASEKENRNFTSEEQESYDKMADQFEELKEREERAITLFQQEREVEQDFGSPIEKRIGSSDAPETFAEYRAQAHGAPVYDQPEIRSAYFKYMVRGWEELDLEEHRALSKASGGAGGFLVPTDFYNQIIRSLRFMGSVANLCTEVITDSGDSINVPANTAHGVAFWTAENAAVTPSDETFAQVTLGANKATSKVIVSEELVQDSAFNLDGFLAQEFGERLGVLENTAYIKGDGSGKPTGLLQTAGTASNITTVTAATGNATSFTYTALVTGMFSLPPQYRRNASWIVSDTAARNLYLMVDSQQRPLWHVNIAESAPDTFLGKPIYTDPDVPAPAANNISVLFGDWKRAYIVRRVRGFGMQRQNELHSDNGQVGFRGIDRVDGKVVLAAAGVALQHSAT